MTVRTITGVITDVKQQPILSVHGSNGSVSGTTRIRTSVMLKDGAGTESAVVMEDDIPSRVGHRATGVFVAGRGAAQIALFRNHDLQQTWAFRIDVASDGSVTHVVLATVFGSLISCAGLFTVFSSIDLGRGTLAVVTGIALSVVGVLWMAGAIRARTRPNRQMMARARSALASATP